MKEPERNIHFSPVGYSFLLSVFMILLLVVFSVLSLSTSLRDQEYSKRNAAKSTAFYEANTKASRILKEIDEIFVKSVNLKGALTQIKSQDGISISDSKDSENTQDRRYQNLISYTVVINSNQNLSVLLGARTNADHKPVYHILKWKEEPAGSWENNNKLPLLRSE